MKLFKKVLAIAMASALALTLLVGCGKDDGKTTFTVVDYLNDCAAMQGADVTFKAATALDTNAKNTVTVLQKNSDAKTVEELYKKVDGDPILKAAVGEAVSGGDTKNAYAIGFASTRSYITDAAKDSAGYLQAAELLEQNVVVYTPDAAKGEDKLERTLYVGTTTMTLGGKNCLVAVVRTAVKAAK